MVGIYLITNKINGKQYVGQTTDFSKRLNDYKRLQCKSQKRLYNALNKYGVDNFRFEFIHECRAEDLNKMEEFFIYKFKTLNPKGYNLTSGGGQGTYYSYESKMAITYGKCKDIYTYKGYGLITAFNEYNEIEACGDIFEVAKQLKVDISLIKNALDSKNYTPRYKDGKIKLYFISNCEHSPDKEFCDYMNY